jgi:hypothetical protein
MDIWMVGIICIIISVHERVNLRVRYASMGIEKVGVSALPSTGVICLFVGLLMSQILIVCVMHHYRVRFLSDTIDQNYPYYNIDKKTLLNINEVNKYSWQHITSSLILWTIITLFFLGIIYMPIFEVRYDILKSRHSFIEVFTLFDALKQLHSSPNSLIKYCLSPFCSLFVVILPCLQQLLLGM